jgi:hypothetical protein
MEEWDDGVSIEQGALGVIKILERMERASGCRGCELRESELPRGFFERFSGIRTWEDSANQTQIFRS